MNGSKEESAKSTNPAERNGSSGSSRKDKLYSKKHKHSRKSTGVYHYSKSGGSLSSNRFSVVEAYKTLRTNLQFSMTRKGCNVIIVTSTMPRDGKSTVARKHRGRFFPDGQESADHRLRYAQAPHE